MAVDAPWPAGAATQRSRDPVEYPGDEPAGSSGELSSTWSAHPAGVRPSVLQVGLADSIAVHGSPQPRVRVDRMGVWGFLSSDSGLGQSLACRHPVKIPRRRATRFFE